MLDGIESREEVSGNAKSPNAEIPKVSIWKFHFAEIRIFKIYDIQSFHAFQIVIFESNFCRIPTKNSVKIFSNKYTIN